MYTLKTLSKTLILFSLLTSVFSCAYEQYLRTDRAGPEELAGTYTLLLYGARHSDDVANVAILDKEGDTYTFEIYAPEYDYSVKTGMSAKEALEKAQAHVRYYHDFSRSRLRKIIDKAGSTVAYELRPLYHAVHLGQSDVLYINYIVKDNKVITTIRLTDNMFDSERDIFRGRAD
jgi:hypothetical protein